ncbi:MAG: peptidyl-tRNA hydrolase [Oribacterium sp.]|nr:peptidyl-tRNA hydrolase [Oribacterium sp.]
MLAGAVFAGKAKNKNHLLKAKEKAEDLGLKEGIDFGLIRDLCLTELEPEDEDGRTTTVIWFRPLSNDVAHEISKKYQLYR